MFTPGSALFPRSVVSGIWIPFQASVRPPINYNAYILTPGSSGVGNYQANSDVRWIADAATGPGTRARAGKPVQGAVGQEEDVAFISSYAGAMQAKALLFNEAHTNTLRRFDNFPACDDGECVFAEQLVSAMKSQHKATDCSTHSRLAIDTYVSVQAMGLIDMRTREELQVMAWMYMLCKLREAQMGIGPFPPWVTQHVKVDRHFDTFQRSNSNIISMLWRNTRFWLRKFRQRAELAILCCDQPANGAGPQVFVKPPE